MGRALSALEEVSPVASVCVDSTYFSINSSGELTIKPGTTGLRDVLIFQTPGTFQFTKATYPWLAHVHVMVQAGGGGSAGAQSDVGELSAQVGGAGGGYSEGHYNVSSLGASETVVVGAAGAAGTPTVDGGAGGNSSFGGLVTANGGFGGTTGMTTGATPACFSGIAAPLAGLGQITMGGGAGGGALRINGSQGLAGVGGDSIMGIGGFQRASTGGGGATRGYGSGAGGALARNGTTEQGTAGAHGIVVIELYA